MSELKRRDAIKGMLVGGAVATINGLGSANAGSSPQNADVIQAARAFRGQHQPKPLPFDPAKLRGLSEKLIRSHHENNYTGALKALNAVEQRLDAMMKDKDLPAYVYGDLKREELVRTGSVISTRILLRQPRGRRQGRRRGAGSHQTMVWQLTNNGKPSSRGPRTRSAEVPGG